MLRSAFVAVEGVDGSGKSGVVRHLAEVLRARGADVLATREPGGTPQGEALRALILSGSDDAWDPASELLLMTAARVEHVRRVIEPALAAGRLVISDRFAGSTLAYQGAGRGLDEGFIRDLHARAVGDLWPQLTLILDVDARTGLMRSRQRLSASAVDEGRFETLELAFHERIRQSFLDQAWAAPHRHVVIDASAPPETVALQAEQAALAHLAG